MNLRYCPECGSRAMRKVVDDDLVRIGGHRVRIPNIKRDRCMKCGGNFYDKDANQAIDAFLLSNPHFLAARLRTLHQARSAKRVAA